MSLTISSSIQLVQYFDTTASIAIASLPANILANIKQIYRLSSTGSYEAWTKDGGKAFATTVVMNNGDKIHVERMFMDFANDMLFGKS